MHTLALLIGVVLALQAQVLEASISGCPVFPANNIWNTPIDTLPVHPNSNVFVNTIGPTKLFHPDFGAGLYDGKPMGIPYIVVSGNQKRVNVTFDYPDQSDPGPYPIPPDAPIEGGSSSDGDRHVLVIDNATCILYETFASYPQNGGASWKAGSGAIFHLRTNELRPDGWTSSDAAGLPLFPGLTRYAEVASGKISHALRFAAPDTRNSYLWPGRHEASTKTGQQYPPLGIRFRMKASFDISGFSNEVKIIFQALKTYGMFLADNGSPWYLGGEPNDNWNNDVLVTEFRKVTGSDFEAVDESSLMVDPNTGEAKQRFVM